MKKFFFLFSILSIAFSSCSSDNDPISQETNFDPVEYTVNLNVKSAGFEVDKTPLKGTQTNSNQASFMQVILYNETGTVYSDTIIDQTSLTAENTPSITLKLPKGNYYMSIFNRIYNKYYNKLEDVVIIPNNYESDYYARGVSEYDLTTRTNFNMYYYTNILHIEGNINTTKEIILEPLWSNVISIKTKLSDTFIYPADINGYIEQISPRYYGFGIKSKLAKTLYPYLYKEFSWLDTSFSASGVPVVISKAEDTNLYFDLCYVKAEDDGYSGKRITKIQRIKLPVEIENGMNYSISGTIPPIDSIDTGIMHISLEPFKDSNISFE